MKSNTAITGDMLGFSILIKVMVYMFWNLGSVHFLKKIILLKENGRNDLMVVLGLKEGQIQTAQQLTSPELSLWKVVSVGSMPFASPLKLLFLVNTFEDLLYFPLYELQSSNCFFSFIWTLYLLLLASSYFYGLPAQHLFKMFRPKFHITLLLFLSMKRSLAS